MRERRQIIMATAVAAALSGAPSTLEAFRQLADHVAFGVVFALIVDR